MNYIIYHSNSSLTGKELKKALNIPGGTSDPGERQNKLIRWGNRSSIRFTPRAVLNNNEACGKAADKRVALQFLSQNNIKTVPLVDRFTGELLVGRPDSHMQGQDFFLISSERDFRLAKEHLGCTHFTTYIPCDREYRVHVFRGQVIARSEKRMGDNATSLTVRNFETGWIFHNVDSLPAEIETLALNAFQSMGLDFGACDIMKSINGNIYILEINTAPSLVKEQEDGTVERMSNFNVYVEKMRNWLNE